MKTYRWCYPWANLPDPSQEFVKYDDHAAALSAEKEKVRELVEGLRLWASWHNSDDPEPGYAEIVSSTFALIEKYSKEEPNNE